MPITPRSIIFALLFPTVVGIIHFTAAGTIQLPAVWALLITVAIFFITMALLVGPQLMAERSKPGPGDRNRTTPIILTIIFIAQWALAGFDVGRLQISPIPNPIRWFGLALYLAALALILYAMKSNPFYSSAVRIQSDRQHRTITQGPYKLVRHPGYTASILAMIAGSLVFGSALAALLTLPAIALFIRRTIIEDRMLQNDLPGYTKYTKQTRYRLLPYIF